MDVSVCWDSVNFSTCSDRCSCRRLGEMNAEGSQSLLLREQKPIHAFHDQDDESRQQDVDHQPVHDEDDDEADCP